MINQAQGKNDTAQEVLGQLEDLMYQSQKTMQISDKLKQLEQEKQNCQDGIRYVQSYQRFKDDKMIDLVEQDYLQDIYSITNANTLSVLYHTLHSIEQEGNCKVKTNSEKVFKLYKKFTSLLEAEYFKCLLANDRHKLIQLFKVYTELELRDQAISKYIDFVSNELIQFKNVLTKDKVQFRIYHQKLNQDISEIFNEEIDSQRGRIIEVFGGELWYKISLDLFNRFMKERYQKFIQETLDTQGKSKEHFAELLEGVLVETRSFFRFLKNNIFKENNLDLDQEAEQILNLIFNDYQKLYSKKEIPQFIKNTENYYQSIIDKIKNDSLSNEQNLKDKKGKVIPNMNKLQSISQSLELNEIQELFQNFTKVINRCKKVSIPETTNMNLFSLSQKFIKEFKEKFLSKIIEFFESELPASEQKVEPLFLENIFKLQIAYQSFQFHFDKVLPLIQEDKQYLNELESYKAEMINEVQTQIQFFNETLLNNICEQVSHKLQKYQKNKDFNIKKRLTEECKTTVASQQIIEFLKPFFNILLNNQYHQKNRLRLLYNLTSKLVILFTEHFQKFTVTQEGAILLSGDINKYNELFLQIEQDDLIKQYESFKLLVNIYLMNEESLEQYIKEHLMKVQKKDVIITYLQKRSDYKSSKLDQLIENLF